MIELAEQQVQSLENPKATPPRVVSPRTHETFVLLRVEDYERLKEEEYDDSPWMSEERHALAWEAGKHAGWEDMDEYHDVPEKPGSGGTWSWSVSRIREGSGAFGADSQSTYSNAAEFRIA